MTTPTSAMVATSPGAGEDERANVLRLQRAAVRDGQIRFDHSTGFAQALRDGCFYLEIPSTLELAPGLRLSREFYRSPDALAPETMAYRGFRDRAGVYFDREHFQTEHVLLDRPGRVAHFPVPLVEMCDQLNELALVVLREVLAQVGIPAAQWALVTGGAVDNAGTHWFASSHYRPERPLLGCAPHKDTGFVTVLYIERDGLEASVAGQWVAIDPMPGCFVVNFGGSLELLTQRLRTPVRAILHRVRQTLWDPSVEDRFSFAAFVNPPATGTLYQWDDAGGATAHGRVEDFLIEFNKLTWNDRHDEFGIK